MILLIQRLRELNFGRCLPAFGRADDDDTDKQPD